MRDPILDPQPGDVIQVVPGWTRSVTARDGDYVKFFADFYGEAKGPYSVSVDLWAESIQEAKAEATQ